jgi:hypothetical protein
MIDFSDPRSSASLFAFISVSAAKKLKAFLAFTSCSDIQRSAKANRITTRL